MAEPEQKPGMPKRINVAVNPETVEMLEREIAASGVSLTEAVRRLIGRGDMITMLSKVKGMQVVARFDDGSEQKVVVL